MARQKPWHLAPALAVLRDEINAAAPQRSKASDGYLGDPKHATRTSDHNLCVCCGVVAAADWTHDPKGGLDCQLLADFLQVRAGKGDVRVKYVIWKKRIMSGPGQRNPCAVWRPYTGKNAHTRHLHLSVTHERVDDDGPWGWAPEAAP
jgi:hypothetical protein